MVASCPCADAWRDSMSNSNPVSTVWKGQKVSFLTGCKPILKESKTDDRLRDNICPWSYNMFILNCLCTSQIAMLHKSLNSLSGLEFSEGNGVWTNIVVVMSFLFNQWLNNEDNTVMVHLTSTIIITSSYIPMKIQCNNVSHQFPKIPFNQDPKSHPLL